MFKIFFNITLLAGISVTGAAALLSPVVPAAADTLVKEFFGSGTSTTRPFVVHGPWEIQWSTRCPHFEPGLCIFQIYVYDSNGHMQSVAANQLGTDEGAAYQPRGGKYYLNINAANVSWAVNVVNVE